jgi:hypothetical protein
MSGSTSGTHDRDITEEKVSIMMLNPEGYIPTEVALRTTQAQQAFRAQPRRTKKRHRFLRRSRRYTLAA